MSTITRSVALASSFALMSFVAAGMATAQDAGNSRKSFNDCDSQQNCAEQVPGNSRKQRSQNKQDTNQDGDQMLRKSRKHHSLNDLSDDQLGMQTRKKRSADNNRNWKFDSNRHDRRRNRDAKFRFYLGGFYYSQPYWTGESYGVQSYRVSCGEGRNIVDESGYNRVRTIECGGGTFTYMGRRNGDTFRVFVNSRTGRIVGRQEV